MVRKMKGSLRPDLFGVIDLLGLEYVIEQAGADRVIEQVGLMRVVEQFGLPQVVEQFGLPRVVDELGGVDQLWKKLSPKQRQELKRLAKE